jgi:acetyltransferase-like isoleucine patch superfamily enzyme/acyl carrier protein
MAEENPPAPPSKGRTAGTLSSLIQRRWLRSIDRVGDGVLLMGRPHFVNKGRIALGDRFFLSSQPVQSHIVAMPGGVIDIGNDVSISYGAAISAQREVCIGRDAEIGPFVVIMDGDFHRPGDREAAGEVAPVHIGAGTIVGARVTILRGATIGEGARILSGSMVAGAVPSGTTVGGVPARAVNDGNGADAFDMRNLVRRVLDLAEPPGEDEGPREIPQWDSLGTLRLLLAIEETCGIAVSADEIQSAKTVAALSEIVDRASESRS